MHGWIGGQLKRKNTVTVDTVAQSSVGRTRKKRQYFCHNAAAGKCMNEIICPCTLKQVGQSYMFGNNV